MPHAKNFRQGEGTEQLLSDAHSVTMNLRHLGRDPLAPESLLNSGKVSFDALSGTIGAEGPFPRPDPDRRSWPRVNVQRKAAVSRLAPTTISTTRRMADMVPVMGTAVATAAADETSSELFQTVKTAEHLGATVGPTDFRFDRFSL
jgi:hypothetical protein